MDKDIVEDDIVEDDIVEDDDDDDNISYRSVRRARKLENKLGRPLGLTRDSMIPVRLSDTADSGYRKIKEFLKWVPHEFRDYMFTRELPHCKIHDISDFVNDMASGTISASILTCQGDMCQYAHRCHLLKNGIQPMDEQCPVEMYMVGQWITHWIDTLDIDSDNIVEMNQMSTMIVCDLMLMRLRNKLAVSPTGNIVYTPVGVDKFGNVILREDAAPEIAMEDKYNKLKERTLNALLATRESRAKHGIMDERDVAKKGAKTISKAREIIMNMTNVDPFDGGDA